MSHPVKNPVYKGPLNRVIALLTFSDIFSWGIYFILSTIAGIYLAGKLGANVLEIVGLGNAIYLLTRATVQIPIGAFTDRLKNDHDEIALLGLGNVFMGLPFILYPLIEDFPIYLGLQFIFGLGAALNLVTWRKLFAKNLDLNQEGKQYATYDFINSIAGAIFSVIAGVVANLSAAYFDLVIFGFGLVMIASSIFPLLIKYVSDRKSRLV